MADKSKIEWTDASWNPVTGCSKVSEGCRFCYAERESHRYGWTTQPWTAQHAAENVVLHPDRLELPLRWKRPRRIFVNSMSDLFHDRVPDHFIQSVFSIMENAKQHTFQVLTKRPGRMHAWVSAYDRWLRYADDQGRYFVDRHPNVLLGVSVEDQKTADQRIPLLLETPAALRFLSCEPLLGPVDLYDHLHHIDQGLGHDYNPGLHWVIAGGESGPHARPTHPDWVRDLRDQCQSANIPFFFKQWGEWAPAGEWYDTIHCVLVNRRNGNTSPVMGGWGKWSDCEDWATMRRFGKKIAGRHIDGQLWDQYPQAPSA
jgi:protein gp37